MKIYSLEEIYDNGRWFTIGTASAKFTKILKRFAWYSIRFDIA